MNAEQMEYLEMTEWVLRGLLTTDETLTTEEQRQSWKIRLEQTVLIHKELVALEKY